MARSIKAPRELFKRLNWPVLEKLGFNISVTFGDGEPPFFGNAERWTAHLRMTSEKDVPEWSIGATSPDGRSTSIWVGKPMYNDLDLPPIDGLAAVPDWLRAVRARADGALSVAFIDAGRNKRAEPDIERWLGWQVTVLASTRRARSDATRLLDWAGAPRSPYDPKALAAEQRRVARQLEADAGGLSVSELRRVTDRVVEQTALFLRSVLSASLSDSVRNALADSLSDTRCFQADALQHLFLAISLRTVPLGEVAAYYRAVGMYSGRLAGLLTCRAKIPATPRLVQAARDACLRFEVPSYLPSCTNADASVFLLLAMDGSSASADALGHVVGVLRAKPHTELHVKVAQVVARDVGSTKFQRRFALGLSRDSGL